jgi:hypothetical protein
VEDAFGELRLDGLAVDVAAEEEGGVRSRR